MPLRPALTRRYRNPAWRFALLGVFLLAVAIGLYWWATTYVTEDERPFIGRWRIEFPTYSPSRPELVVEIELRPRGIRRDWILDSRTGEVEDHSDSPYRWEVSNGRYQESAYGNAIMGLFGGRSKPQTMWDYSVTWEGENRFRLTNPAATRPVMVWFRQDQTDTP